jgi:hypothetical protein
MSIKIDFLEQTRGSPFDLFLVIFSNLNYICNSNQHKLTRLNRLRGKKISVKKISKACKCVSKNKIK